ncbi:MAG: type II secretion system major pseudopilin GspG [Kiritimatiellae bacterium]|nr:type II secretion system major pseudopilin GspG [Kiritimatiellia bacterium]
MNRGKRTRRALAAARDRQAFTLVEMLLVLVILAALAAVVVPKFAGRGQQAKVTAAQTQISNFEVALDAFEVDMAYYPRGGQGLNELIEVPAGASGWRGPYLKKGIPLDPWGHAYVYQCPGRHNPDGYDLMSMGPDGQAGGDDDITNWEE